MTDTTPRLRRRLRVTAIALSSVAAIGLVGVGAFHSGQVAPTARAATGGPVEASPGYADLVERVLPSVVSIRAVRSYRPHFFFVSFSTTCSSA